MDRYIEFLKKREVRNPTENEKTADKPGNTASQDASIKESEQYKELGKRSPSAGMFYSEYIKLKNKQYDKNH